MDKITIQITIQINNLAQKQPQNAFYSKSEHNKKQVSKLKVKTSK